MKFVKRISLFFIYPLAMFSIGFATNMAIMEFFYLDEKIQTENLEAPEPEKEPVQVSVSDEPVVTADTRYVIQDYNAVTGEVVEKEESAPDKFIGLCRDKVVDEIKEYNANPSLTDLEQGFTFMELVSFSSGRIVVRKSFEPAQEEKGFFLLNENHYVVVYDHSLSRVYMNTDILVERLPEELRDEILNIKYVEDEKELYNFLESYSSYYYYRV